MKRILNYLKGHAAEIVMGGGAAAMAVGAGMLSLPWGFIVGGVLALAGGALSLYGTEDDGA